MRCRRLRAKAISCDPSYTASGCKRASYAGYPMMHMQHFCISRNLLMNRWAVCRQKAAEISQGTGKSLCFCGENFRRRQRDADSRNGSDCQCGQHEVYQSEMAAKNISNTTKNISYMRDSRKSQMLWNNYRYRVER